MKAHRIVFGVVLLTVALGFLTTQFAQEPSTASTKSERRWVTLGLLRAINTYEVHYRDRHNSFGTWDSLLSDGLEYFEGFLSTHGFLQNNVRFADASQILPGWSLRLNVHVDGQGYDVLVEDITDKEGYAALSDERAVIRECKWIK